MAALDVDVFRSKQFVFVVGENQAAFTVHAAIIAKQSKALDVLINGSMGEASDGKAVFEDVEEDTFIRFCQFAYTGDYTTPDFTHTPKTELPDITPPDTRSLDRKPMPEPEPMPEWMIEEEPKEDPPAEYDDPWVFGSKKAKKSPRISFSREPLQHQLSNTLQPSKSSLLRKSLNDQRYDTETTRKIFAARCEVRQNSDSTEDYTPVFLGHAQLYVFAEKWGVECLKTLALFKLHNTLTTFTLYAARRPDIVELLRYTFSNNHTPDLVDAVDDLRSLVILYATCEVESLIQCPEFLLLIGEGGQLAQDLVQILMKRIS